MKLQNYDSRNTNIIFFDNLSNADKMKLGIENIEENYYI